MTSISIITVAYNSEKTIRDTILSVLSQSYSKIEYIIIDGGSSDGTKKIINEYIDDISYFISEQDKGIYDAMNKGIKVAKGEIIGILNSDDIYFSNETVSDVEMAFRGNKADALYGDLVYFRGNNYEEYIRYWKSREYYRNFFHHGNTIPHPTLFVKRMVYDVIGGYHTDYKITSDFEFMLRAFVIKDFRLHYMSKTLVKMRMGGESTKNVANIVKGNLELYDSWIRNDLKFPFFLYFLRPIKKVLQLFILK